MSKEVTEKTDFYMVYISVDCSSPMIVSTQDNIKIKAVGNQKKILIHAN
jgi:hypothetical protein